MQHKDTDPARANYRANSKRWYERHPFSQVGRIPPEAYRAHNAVKAALRRGDLVRPDICEECLQQRYCEAAHNDYSQPLAVRWLCRSCHHKWDRATPKMKRDF